MKSANRVLRTRVLTEFVDRLEQAVAERSLTVFVCGPSVSQRKKRKKPSSGAIARQFITTKIAEAGSIAIWGEHFDKRKKKLSAGRVTFRYFTDADKEILFAHRKADLIVILPESAGSLAELGGFSLHNDVASKMLVVFDKQRKGDKGYVVQAVARAAKSRNARISYRDYSRLGDLWKVVDTAIREQKTKKITSDSYAKA